MNPYKFISVPCSDVLSSVIDCVLFAVCSTLIFFITKNVSKLRIKGNRNPKPINCSTQMGLSKKGKYCKYKCKMVSELNGAFDRTYSSQHIEAITGKSAVPRRLCGCNSFNRVSYVRVSAFICRFSFGKICSKM